ncbi:MAG: transcriptional repressor [Paludibacter sp.]|nr:transcriptional repressor [Bacteroidales bacterium]MCM1068628.1 transcriptional repressor [Prevotella sp.]MCM1353292.1 transcriptional repressor [Bacteroides sp.]MCM1442300.1 transcriptional repressor [Muribaculum sp.]MCM1481119.1 transcriptional repressor [Paludibacter sp.]
MEERHVHSAEDLLQQHEVKVTPNRLIVLRALQEAKRPMGLIELEDVIQTLDKSSIFRALILFKEQHLVHVIEDGCGGVKYECCQGCAEGKDDDVHVHFHCEECHSTYCMDAIPIPEVVLPIGYKAQTANYVIKGVCPQCAKKN